MPLSPRKARHFPPHSGEADTKEESNQVLYLYTHLCVSLAGFFAKSHMMFFLLSLFLFCPPLKNDGRGAFGFSTMFWPVYANLPLSLRSLGTSLRIRGKLIIRKKKFIVLNCITYLFCQKNKKRKPSPLVGRQANRFALAKVAAPAVGRGKSEQKGKRVSYKTVLNTDLSFLNGGKKRSGIAI